MKVSGRVMTVNKTKELKALRLNVGLAVGGLIEERGKNVSNILSVADYKVLQEADILMDGLVARVLNQNGCANWTVCPECRVDDFTHVEGCAIWVDG